MNAVHQININTEGKGQQGQGQNQPTYQNRKSFPRLIGYRQGEESKGVRSQAEKEEKLF